MKFISPFNNNIFNNPFSKHQKSNQKSILHLMLMLKQLICCSCCLSVFKRWSTVKALKALDWNLYWNSFPSKDSVYTTSSHKKSSFRNFHIGKLCTINEQNKIDSKFILKWVMCLRSKNYWNRNFVQRHNFVGTFFW